MTTGQEATWEDIQGPPQWTADATTTVWSASIESQISNGSACLVDLGRLRMDIQSDTRSTWSRESDLYSEQ